MGDPSDLSELTADTLALVEKLFAPEKQGEARRLLGSTFSLQTVEDVERARFAALKHSKGDLTKLEAAVNKGNYDFRDLLSLGGFSGSSKAHGKWRDTMLGTGDTESENS